MIQFDNGPGIVNTTLGFVCGILGGIVIRLSHTAPLTILAAFQAGLTALICGAAGVAGKEFYLYVKRRIKTGDHKKVYQSLMSLIQKIKRKK